MPDTITKRDMAKRIARKLQIHLPIVQQVIQAVLDTIIDDLAAGKRIELRGFGVFETRRRDAKRCFHFGKHEMMEIPSKIVVRFRPGGPMKKRIEATRKEME